MFREAGQGVKSPFLGPLNIELIQRKLTNVHMTESYRLGLLEIVQHRAYQSLSCTSDLGQIINEILIINPQPFPQSNLNRDASTALSSSGFRGPG